MAQDGKCSGAACGSSCSEKGSVLTDPVSSRLLSGHFSSLATSQFYFTLSWLPVSLPLRCMLIITRGVFSLDTLNVKEDSGRPKTFKMQMNKLPMTVFQQRFFSFSFFERESFLKCLISHLSRWAEGTLYNGNHQVCFFLLNIITLLYFLLNYLKII